MYESNLFFQMTMPLLVYVATFQNNCTFGESSFSQQTEQLVLQRTRVIFLE